MRFRQPEDSDSETRHRERNSSDARHRREPPRPPPAASTCTALRDRLSSGPKTLAARQAALANRQAEVETARKALQDAKMHVKKHEHSLKAIDTKIDDLKVKLNLVKKNDEYKALQNQIAHDNTSKAKIEEDILSRSRRSKPRRPRWPSSRPTSRRFAAEAAALQQQLDQQGVDHKAQLQELETAIVKAETRHPRRTTAKTIAGSSPATGPTPWPPARTVPATAASPRITPQMSNDLINGEGLSSA